MSLLISIAVYGVDTFTAYNLIALDTFSGFTPAIPLTVAKWIFVGCIIASWVNVIYEHIRAWRTIARGAVAESYLDSLAVRLQSIRIFGRGRGWKRFLVFSELTKSKKGAEYVALFTYFSFQSWIRVIFCSGPRQVVNALTLWGVYKKELNPSDPDPATSILRFFENFAELARSDRDTAVVLSGMTFTLVIWVFAALSLLLALCFYLLFLWHYIPKGDGGLSGYCQRKIEGRLAKIVSVKVNAAIEEEERKRLKQDQKMAMKNGEKPVLGRQATIPVLFETKDSGGDKLPSMPMLNRNDTTATLPMYESRSATPSGGPTVPDVELSNLEKKRPYPPSRLATANSTTSMKSYASNAPLMAGAADMGRGRPASPAPSLPHYDDQDGYPFPGPERTITGSTQATNWSQPSRNGTPGINGQPTRNGTPGVNGQRGARNLTPLDRSWNMTPMERTESPMSYGNPMDRSANMTPMARNMTPGYGNPANPVDRARNITPRERTMTPASYNPMNPPYPQRSDTTVSANAYGARDIMRNNPNTGITSDYLVSPLDRIATLPTFENEPTLPNLEQSLPNLNAQPTLPTFDDATSSRNEPTVPTFDNDTNTGTARVPSQPSTTYNPYGDRPAPNHGRSTTGQSSVNNPYPAYGRSTPSQSSTRHDPNGRASPAPSQHSDINYRGPVSRFPVNPSGGYPGRSASAAIPQNAPQGNFRPPVRNVTAPPPRGPSTEDSYDSSDLAPRIGTPAGLRNDGRDASPSTGQNNLFSNSDTDVERGYGQQNGGTDFKY